MLTESQRLILKFVIYLRVLYDLGVHEADVVSHLISEKLNNKHTWTVSIKVLI